MSAGPTCRRTARRSNATMHAASAGPAVAHFARSSADSFDAEAGRRAVGVRADAPGRAEQGTDTDGCRRAGPRRAWVAAPGVRAGGDD